MKLPNGRERVLSEPDIFFPFKLTMFQLVKGSSLDILRRISHLGSRLSLPKEERRWKKKCGKASHAGEVKVEDMRATSRSSTTSGYALP
jgi:hypothetical protein